MSAKNFQNLKTIFADPLNDVALKILLLNKNHKDILINVINSLLNFHGNNEIKEAYEHQSVSFYPELKKTLEMRCTTKSNENIRVEIQRQYYDFRVEIAHYRQDFLKTFILVISKENIFELENDKLYEKTIVPMTLETKTEAECLPISLKYYELKKFVKMHDSGEIKLVNDKLPLKEQWLDFFYKCSTCEKIPDDVDNIIKEAYRIMKVTEWEPLFKRMYEESIQREKDEIKDKKIKEFDDEIDNKPTIKD
ncbi:unnamed protein product [Brachionus calyciflorus]|uniref:PD-(D/E)XK nuclease family transposase n=1 Tax=Brachionus calyciflorus TaxID=104777 RepID=A0A813TWK9_9BILA|nr:unnamed protein product [Brachionus calyciflorus]